MTQGLENDLLDVRFYLESTPVLWNRDNEPLEDLNTNTLTVDNKAILARDTALQAQADLVAHIPGGGVPEHASATTTVSGFLSAPDKAKLDLIQDKAQLNILAPVDAVDLISRKPTTLHEHVIATITVDGFLSTSDKIKFDTIETGAQVNSISVAEATTLISGGNADLLHFHDFAAGIETFTEAVHSATDHTGIPGIGAFPGFLIDGYNVGATQTNPGVTIFSNTYTLSTLDVLTAGWAQITEFGWFGKSEKFSLSDITISGLNGIVTYEVIKANGAGDMSMTCWQGGHGLL